MGEDITAPVTHVTEKVAFASPEWVEIARVVLEELVAEHGETGRSYSVCEVFIDAPPGMAGSDETTAAWHFRIVNKTVAVGEGEIADAELNVRVDYQAALPAARRIYAREMASRTDGDPRVDSETTRDRSNMPRYLVELHNRLAELTQ